MPALFSLATAPAAVSPTSRRRSTGPTPPTHRGIAPRVFSKARPASALSAALRSNQKNDVPAAKVEEREEEATPAVAEEGLSTGIAAAVTSGFTAEQLRSRVAPLATGVCASVLITLGAAFSGISATASGGGSGFALPYSQPEVQTHSSDAAIAMAKKLKAAGAKMYGAFWCSHCFQQKEYFGQEAMADFPYVECYPEGFFRGEDGKGTVIDKACSDIGIRGFPTWVINGKNYEGEQSLENLEADLAIRS